MLARLAPLTLLLLSACSSLPSNWVDPGSSTGVHDSSLADLVASDGTHYRIQWRGDYYNRERSAWTLDTDGDLDERVLPWGPWKSTIATGPGIIFAHDRETKSWTRYTDGGSTAQPMEGCKYMFNRTDSQGRMYHYMDLANPSRIALITPMGEQIRSTPGDTMVIEDDVLYVTHNLILVAVTDFDLQSILEEPPEQVVVRSFGTVYILHRMDGHMLLSFRHGLVNRAQFDVLEPLSYPDSGVVLAWIAREVGETKRSLRDASTITRLAEDLQEVVEIGDYEDGYMGAAAKHYELILVRTGDQAAPYKLFNLGGGSQPLESGLVPTNLIAQAVSQFTLTRVKAEKAEYEEQVAEYNAQVAEQERVAEAQQLAQAEELAERHLARQIYLAALSEGGFSEQEIQRNESAGVPMIVVDGTAHAGRRLETWPDIDYPDGIRWEKLPTAFTIWNAGARRWVAGLMVRDRDGIRRALTFMDGHLSAQPASYLEGEYVLPISVEQTLVSCSECGGDGVETVLAKVQRGTYLGGDYSLSLEKVKIGRSTPTGHWVTNHQWTPNACPRCLGHGSTPF